MLKPYAEQRIVERILTNKDGEVFKVVFLLTFVNGEIKARVLSATALRPQRCACLPTTCTETASEFSYEPAFSPSISWFDELFFFMSQPTRAPAAGITY